MNKTLNLSAGEFSRLNSKGFVYSNFRTKAQKTEEEG